MLGVGLPRLARATSWFVWIGDQQADTPVVGLSSVHRFRFYLATLFLPTPATPSHLLTLPHLSPHHARFLTPSPTYSGKSGWPQAPKRPNNPSFKKG
ncbi:MAG TPA: hypothetical protein VII61_14380 [Ktedonobacteraceae bacterium]